MNFFSISLISTVVPIVSLLTLDLICSLFLSSSLKNELFNINSESSFLPKVHSILLITNQAMPYLCTVDLGKFYDFSFI